MNIKLSQIIKEDNNCFLFDDNFEPFLLSEDFKSRYGKYLPFSYKFRFINNVIYRCPLDDNFFDSVIDITLEDMLFKNYTPLEITIKNNKIFILDGHHRILRFLILCLENNIDLSSVELNYTYIKDI